MNNRARHVCIIGAVAAIAHDFREGEPVAVVEIGHIDSTRYLKACDYPVMPKKERNYPTLKERIRGHR